MKTVAVSSQAAELNSLLEQARVEDILVQSDDGAEYLLSLVDEFDREIALTRQNAKLMDLLDERAAQTRTVSIEDVERQLGLDRQEIAGENHTRH
jgi:hypothetical protein